MTQTLADGESKIEELAMKYVPSDITGIKPADAIVLLLLGLPNSGKSRFLQTHPSLTIINFDGSPFTHPAPVAELWPGSGRPSSWPAAVDYLATVIEAVEAEQTDAPTTVAFDCFSTMLSSAREYAAYHLYARSCARERKTPKPIEQFTPFELDMQHGQKVWTLTYDWIGRMITLCQKAGLGVIIPVHLTYKIEEFGKGDDAVRIERLAPDVTSNQMSLIYKIADASLLVTREDETKTIQVPKVRMRGGKERTFMEPENVLVVKQLLHVRHGDENLQRYIKARVRTPMPDTIDIGEREWFAFAEVWNSNSGVSDNG